jgi:hypothetical protein
MTGIYLYPLKQKKAMGEDLGRKVLYVGIDDSNHAGKNKGEVVLATFSFLHEDSLVKKFPNKRDSRMVEEWIKNPARDYRFAILEDEKFRHCSTNLPYAAPGLVRSFLKDYGGEIEKIKLYLDGLMHREHKEALRKEFCDFPFVVDNFIKNQGIHNCPSLVYMADILSHQIYLEGFEDESRKRKKVELSDYLK